MTFCKLFFVALFGFLSAHILVTEAVAQSVDENFFVANTTPPDAYLALRTHPSSSIGQRIATMPNGTLLKVLQRRADGWWHVRILTTGQEGWALSGRSGKTWIECCIRSEARSQALRIYTPPNGSIERVAIMDAARKAMGQPIRFKVNYLFVASDASRGIAITDMEDAAQQYPVGSIFFEKAAGVWRALYNIGTDGSDECKEVAGLYDKIFEKARSLNVALDFFPKRVLERYAAIKNSPDKDCEGTIVYGE
jgi:hypothetical protein